MAVAETIFGDLLNARIDLTSAVPTNLFFTWAGIPIQSLFRFIATLQ